MAVLERRVDVTSAIAYGATGYTLDLAQAFAQGCGVHDVPCEVRASDQYDGIRPCDLIWLYGLHFTRGIFNAYKNRATRVVGDLGYWRENASLLPVEQRPIRISVDAEQPDAHLTRRWHSSKRFQALGLEVYPVTKRGESILLCGHAVEQAHENGYAYGQWEAETVARLRKATDRQIFVRAKPGCPTLLILGTKRAPDTDVGSAIRNSWAVVCRSGNIGADAILHGVPVFAESGPGAVYHKAPLGYIDFVKPLPAQVRIAALSDIAHWQWTQEEIERGDLWRHLLYEGMV